MRYLEEKKDQAYKEWLESSQSKSYQKVRRDIFLRFHKFLEEQGFQNPTGTSLLERHIENRKSTDNKKKYEIDDLIPKFSQWLIDTCGVTHNSAVNMAVPSKDSLDSTENR